jgi:hypothetical protein
MYLINKVDNEIIGQKWVVRIAKKRNLENGFWLYNETYDIFKKQDNWVVSEQLKKKIKLIVFSNTVAISLSFQQVQLYRIPVEIEIETTEDKYSIINTYLFSNKLVVFNDSFAGFNFKLQEAIESNNKKGLSQEERFFFYKHFQVIEFEKKQKELEKLKTVEGKLKLAIESAGGEYVSHIKTNDIIVTWKLNDRQIISQVTNELKVIHAGFCVSGYDKTQTLTSLILLLKTYMDDDEHITITRR